MSREMHPKALEFPLQLSNSLTHAKEPFEPVSPPAVGMYVCGPTVYGEPHLGHARSAVTFDILFRYLLHLGYKVRYVRNITDVGHLQDEENEQGEDKIARKARLEQIEPMEVAQLYTNLYHQGMDALNCYRPSIEPHATGHIPEQIALIEELLRKGFAYEANGSVYFDLTHYREVYAYGELSGKVLDELQVASRDTAGQGEKRGPHDFALWKKAEPSHIMRWTSPWGEGFPGWHIECTAMSTKYLGETFDIHGGGLDLQFPHHEAEIAQSCGAFGHGPARVWIHHNMVTMDGAKMSKSAGNFVTLNELFTGSHAILERAYSPMSIRFLMLQSHYHSPIDFSNEALQAAEKALHRLLQAANVLRNLAPQVARSAETVASGSQTTRLSPSTTASEESMAWPKPSSDLEKEFTELFNGCYQTLSDDLNTAKTLAVLFEIAGKINALYHHQLDAKGLSNAFLTWIRVQYETILFDVLGLKEEVQSQADRLTGVLDLIISLRAKARGARDFETSDQIRDTLEALGIRLKDGKGGTTEVEYVDPDESDSE